jgi:hypothetical protein
MAEASPRRGFAQALRQLAGRRSRDAAGANLSRARLKRALAARDASAPAIVPLVEAHAARLEQLAESRWRLEAEAQARMHRSAQALYGLDAVTVAAGGWLDSESSAIACDVVRRLRPVLGERAGIAVVLPAKPLDALTEIIQTIGGDEPELLFVRSDASDVDPTLESLAEFYGAALVAIGARPTEGVVALPANEFATAAEPPRGWLYTTRSELDPAADPQKIRAAIAELRKRHGG